MSILRIWCCMVVLTIGLVGLCPPVQAADEPTQCVGGAEWLKPGNHYSHWLRLRDGRLLLTWTHRNNVIDDDGFGTGTREHPHQTLT